MSEFNKERKEHPSFTDEQVRQIVKDHDGEDNAVTFAYKKLKGK